MTISYHLLDFHKEDCSALFRLFELTYGSSEPLKRRWQWQYLDHPRSGEIQILVAEEDNKIVGFTSHFPMDVMFQGQVLKAFHGSGSMIDPAFRRRGIMWGMVAKRAELLPLYYARGVAPKMYELLMKFGYTPIYPNNYMICIVSKPRWLLRKLKLYQRPGTLPQPLPFLDKEYYFIDEFGEEFDLFFNRVAPQYHLLPVKDAAFMNWRYVKQPYIKYYRLYRKIENRITTVMVLKGTGHIGKIVDIIWDPQIETEPYDSIGFANNFFKNCGFTNVYCWGTHKRLRDCLGRHGYINLKETPLFCVMSQSGDINQLADGDKLHFVDGDGDYEYLE